MTCRRLLQSLRSYAKESDTADFASEKTIRQNAKDPMTIPIERLRELLSYEERSGLLVWKTAPSTHRCMAGQIAVHESPKGYGVVTYKRFRMMAHRIVWALHHGQWPECLDHIDGNKMNNRITNLRLASAAENARNRGKMASNTSGRKGVSWDKSRQTWRASIMADGVNHELGSFDNLDDAAAAYDAAALRLHQNFAKTNKMLEEKISRPYLTGEPNIRMYDPRPRSTVRL